MLLFTASIYTIREYQWIYCDHRTMQNPPFTYATVSAGAEPASDGNGVWHRLRVISGTQCKSRWVKDFAILALGFTESHWAKCSFCKNFPPMCRTWRCPCVVLGAWPSYCPCVRASARVSDHVCAWQEAFELRVQNIGRSYINGRRCWKGRVAVDSHWAMS